MLLGYAGDWLHLLLRWIHFIVGVAWIGASFYFNWLENRLQRDGPQKPGIVGHLWAIHGGGIYYLEKYQTAPPQLPDTLHWFKWEAYFTWISGFALLVLVYYFNAHSFLIDPSVADLTPSLAIGIGIGSMVVGWLLYHYACDSALGNHPLALSLVIFVLLAAAAFGLAQTFSGRAAYLHVGAIIGTMMVANVFFVIIPSQKQLVAAVTAGTAPDPRLGARALLRSRHNNYLTLPVLFIMISSHFPTTYGHPYNWAVLVGLSAVALLVRHYFNVRHRRHLQAWMLPAAALGLLALAFASAPRTPLTPPLATRSASLESIMPIVHRRCASCHSVTPSDDVFTTAPGGVLLDTPSQVKRFAARIHARSVATRDMPLANKTEMTDTERALLDLWYRQTVIAAQTPTPDAAGNGE